MDEEILLIQLRDCFTAGYTFPQFCIDNGIKKPLFVIPGERHATFMWEVYVQFTYDRRITPKFAISNGNVCIANFIAWNNFPPLKIEALAAINLAEYDKVILITNEKSNLSFQNAIYLDELTKYFTSRAYVDIPLLHFLQRNPKVKLLVTNFPLQPVIDDRGAKDIPALMGRLGYSAEDVAILGSEIVTKTNLDGSTTMEDNPNPLVGIKNNQRITTHQPEHYVNKIYFVGTCHQYGINAPFDKTIASYLQKMLVDNNLPYRVENLSQRYFNRYQDLFYNLVKLAPKPNDIIFVYVAGISARSLPLFDVRDAFKFHDYNDVWITHGHSNEVGYKILAEHFFELLTRENFFKDNEFHYPPPPQPPHRYGIPHENSSPATTLFDSEELEAYKKNLRGHRLKIGCLTINANPFHLGHEYLVEYAASRVHKLFILVDSEDKSEFTFEERFELVKRGTEKFSNVEVLPSGKFFASMKTFAGYFNKEQLQDVYVDSTDNAEMFAAEIAPSLGVNIKFDGEEPCDNVTRQYHDNLRILLPRYGIEYCEIPRREIDGEIVSAKTVRAALKAGDFDKLKKIVPSTTYDYLREKYFQK